jgi:nicotinamidase-related amidase
MERVSRDNAVLCLIEHQVGLFTGVRDITPGELKHDVAALAKAAQLLGLPLIVATTAKNEIWGPTVPEVIEALKGDYPVIDRMTVNAWDDPAFVDAVKATGRTHIIFASVALQVCAAYPAYSAIDEGDNAYVVLDASGSVQPRTTGSRDRSYDSEGRDADGLYVNYRGDHAHQCGSARHAGL